MNRDSSEKIIRNVLAISGCAVTFLSLFLAFTFYYGNAVTTLSLYAFRSYLFIIVFEYLFSTAFTGINKSFVFRGFFKETFVVFQFTFALIIFLILILFLLHNLTDSKRLIIAYFSVSFFTLELLTRMLIKYALVKLYKTSKFSSKLLVIADTDCRNSIRRLVKNFDWRRNICGISVPEITSANKKIRGIEAVCTHQNLLDYITHNNIDEIFILVNLEEHEELKDIILQTEEMGIRVNIRINHEMFDYLPRSFIHVSRIGNLQCISVSRKFVSKRKIFAKNLLDYTGGLVGFLIFCLVYIVLAPIIKLDSKGPVIFAQNRVGRNGRIFKCYKFRSMRSDAEELKKTLMAKNEMNGLMFKIENDPRITKVGHFIRKTSIDELPQFLNVLKGDMSLVGTRPPTVDEYNHYEPKHKARVSMAPGLTGLWQVSGRSDIKNFDDVVKLDMEYINNWSVLLDIKIILLTIKVVLFGKGAK